MRGIFNIDSPLMSFLVKVFDCIGASILWLLFSLPIVTMGAAGAALYYLQGDVEFYWHTSMTLPATGFNGIPVALLAANHPIGVIFTGCFMSMLNIVGLQLTNLTAYNEYITDVIISVIVYLSAFSLLIKMLLNARKTNKSAAIVDSGPDSLPEEKAAAEDSAAKGGEQA